MGIGVRVALSPPCARSGPGAAKAYCEKFLMPEKLTGPAEPPVTLSADQSQVPEREAARQHRAYSYIAADACRARRGKGQKGGGEYAPVQEPEPQLTATRCASLLTAMELVVPTKFTPCNRRGRGSAEGGGRGASAGVEGHEAWLTLRVRCFACARSGTHRELHAVSGGAEGVGVALAGHVSARCS